MAGGDSSLPAKKWEGSGPTPQGVTGRNDEDAARESPAEPFLVVPSPDSTGRPYDVVALVASAGGLKALGQVLSDLPPDFPAPIVVIQHLDPRHRSLMAELLNRRTRLRVKEAQEGDHLTPHTVYVAPPDYHLLVNPDGTLSLAHSEMVHFLRHSADLLFESVDASFKERAIAVVLTGTGTDGAMGVQAIKRLLKAEHTARAEAEAAQKFQRTLLDSIAHDLGTPLTSITGSLGALVADWDRIEPEARRELLTIAYDEAKRLGRLVTGLLEMTRFEARTSSMWREPGKIEDILQEALAQLHQTLDGRRVQVHVPPEVPPVPMDATLLTLVFTNLLDNAVKFSSPETPITLDASLEAASVIIRVADRGIGIPPGDLARIFEKFYRGRQDPQIGGSGIGLAIAKGIVEAHKGQIWAEHRDGGGTAVVVRLPLE